MVDDYLLTGQVAEVLDDDARLGRRRIGCLNPTANRNLPGAAAFLVPSPHDRNLTNVLNTSSPISG